MSHKKVDNKVLAQQKRHRRQWITFLRMCRYGANNFTRNAWLTVAATAVMTITLLIMFVTFAARNVLADSVDEVSKKVDMSIYLKTDTTTAQANSIMKDLRALSNVDTVRYISADDARKDFVAQNKQDSSTLEALNNASNHFPSTIRINLKDINNTSQLDEFIKTNKTLQSVIYPDKEPSFAGPRRDAIQGLARWIEFAQKVGLVASVIFVAISSLIVFNTIRMAIFNRKEEIQMMKLIGADRSFIRGPFVVEAMVYGFIAAVLATITGFVLLYSTADKLKEYGVAVQPTIDNLTTFVGVVLIAMIALGALIGTVSSLLATQRYLKI